MPQGHPRQSLVVIGAGVSGLSAAWLLSTCHDVTLVEQEAVLGGHAHTRTVATPHGPFAVDTGFIVYNLETYPNLIALFEHLGVDTKPAPMSFAVSLDKGRLEYSGSGLSGLFGQRSNILSPTHWRMTRDIVRFNREAAAVAAEANGSVGATQAMHPPGPSLGEWLAKRDYSQAFMARYVKPMAAAIWSTPADRVFAFPAEAFFRFFANHGLLTVAPKPTWRTVVGGSRVYIDRLQQAFRGRIIAGDAAVSVTRGADGVSVRLASGAEIRSDQVVIACHGDTALRLLSDPNGDEQALLSAFRYARNEAILHSDPCTMPKRRRIWSSWNYIGVPDGQLTVTYWMNALQTLPTAQPLLVTLNPAMAIAPDRTHARLAWRHPLFDGAAMNAQRGLWTIQGIRRTWFCGSYFGYGFHEDGLQSGLAVAEAIGGVRRPWRVAGESDRVLGGIGTSGSSLAPGVASSA